MFRTPRIAALLAAMMLLASTSAWAQVAVPELVPVAPRLYGTASSLFPRTDVVPLNPGALQWGAPSRVGGGIMHGHSDYEAGPSSTKAEGHFGGARLAFDRLSLAVSQVKFNISYDLSERNLTHSQWALGFEGLPGLAAGIAQTSSEREELYSTGGFRQEERSRIFGASWRIGEVLFLGGAYGRDYLHLRVDPLPATEADRGQMMAGIGLRGGGAVLWHIEALGVEAQDYRDKFGNNLDGGYTLTQATAEMGFWNLLFAYTGYHVTVGEASGDATVKGFTVDAGITPPVSLSVMGRYEANEYESAAGVIVKDKVASAVLTYQW